MSDSATLEQPVYDEFGTIANMSPEDRAAYADVMSPLTVRLKTGTQLGGPVGESAAEWADQEWTVDPGTPSVSSTTARRQFASSVNMYGPPRPRVKLASKQQPLFGPQMGQPVSANVPQFVNYPDIAQQGTYPVSQPGQWGTYQPESYPGQQPQQPQQAWPPQPMQQPANPFVAPGQQFSPQQGMYPAQFPPQPGMYPQMPPQQATGANYLPPRPMQVKPMVDRPKPAPAELPVYVLFQTQSMEEVQATYSDVFMSGEHLLILASKLNPAYPATTYMPKNPATVFAAQVQWPNGKTAIYELRASGIIFPHNGYTYCVLMIVRGATVPTEEPNYDIDEDWADQPSGNPGYGEGAAVGNWQEAGGS